MLRTLGVFAAGLGKRLTQVAGAAWIVAFSAIVTYKLLTRG